MTLIEKTYSPYLSKLCRLICMSVVTLLLLTPIRSEAQIKIGENVTIGGRIGLDISYYERINITDSRDPFRIRFTAQPYFKIKNVTIKTNIVVGDYHKKYAQEFNKFGTTVEYKELLKLHMGHFNQNFTPMTLQGHTILGGGIELNPGIFRFAASYGRFKRDIDPTSFSDVFARASYNRWGLAGKIGFGKEHKFVDLIILRVGDLRSSLDAVSAGTITPAENAILSIHTKQRIWKKLELEGEFAISAFTNDLRNGASDSSDFQVAKIAGYMIERNASTDYAMAIRAGLTYRNNARKNESGARVMNGFSISINYDRIDPDYKSMGTYFLRNDLQRVKLNGQMRFKEGKLMISPQAGWETTDLDSRNTAKTNRFIGGLATSVRLNNSTFVNLSYMNFNNALESNAVDSLILRKVSHNIQGGIQNRHETKAGKKNSFRLNAGYQTGKNKSAEGNSTYLGSYNIQTSYAAVVVEKALELQPSFRMNSYKRTSGQQYRFTPGIATKSYFLDNKMSLNYSLSTILATFKATGISSTSLRNDVRWTYRFVKKQSISFRIGYQQNFYKADNNYGDFKGDFRYTINL